MDNIYDYLKADHRKVSNLFKQFEKAPTAEAKVEFVSMIVRELIVHAETEQNTFYKVLEKFSTSADEAWHGVEEHSEIENKIAEISEMPKPNKAWENKVLELKKLVEHHVSEEEGPLFRRAKKVLSDYDAYVIREQMHDLKEKMLNSLEKEEAI